MAKSRHFIINERIRLKDLYMSTLGSGRFFLLFGEEL